MTRKPLLRDKWGRHECFIAEWHDPVGASSRCLFSNLDAAIFFVVTGIGSWVDWENFPSADSKYPYEERDGNGPMVYTPTFRVDRTIEAPQPVGRQWAIGKKVGGTVTKTSISDSWTVGNGIAVSSQRYFLSAVGRNKVVLQGEGDRLCAVAGETP